MLLGFALNGKGPAVYEEIAHIPMIIKGGAYCKSPSNEVYEGVTSHIDLVPTILDYFNVERPPVLEGKSMKSIIEDPKNNKLNDQVFVEFHRYEIDHDGFGGIQFMRGVVTPEYKMAIHLLDETDELYDTANDVNEMNNLIFDENYSEVRKDLHQKVLDFMNNTRDPYRGYQWKRRTWNKDSEKGDWEVDYYTRQRPSYKDELVQLDYDTGLEITETVRFKKKGGGISG